MRCSTLRVGLLTPNTTIAIEVLKQYYRNQRMRNSIQGMIELNEQLTHIESGLLQHPIKTNSIVYYQIIQIDRIREILKIRGFKVTNKSKEWIKITKNKMIMDYALKYTAIKLN